MPSIVFGTYESFFKYEIEWLDEQGSPIGTKTIKGISYSDVTYGQYVKVRIKGDDTSIFFLRGFTICDENNKDIIRVNYSDLQKESSNSKISKPIYFSVLHYNDHLAKFNSNYDVELKKPQKYYIKITNDRFTDAKDLLIPYTYVRNSEEQMGLVPITYIPIDTTNPPFYIVPPKILAFAEYKDSVERNYIKKSDKISKLVKDFIKKVTKKKDPKDTVDVGLAKLEVLVNTFAKKLWEESVKYTKASSDDRPLYWARLKMQVYLKRNPLFAGQIDYETNLVKPSTKLSDIIELFEQKSRNYSDAKFKGGGKKILVTGFDPFGLNINIKQSNPSGVLALVLAGEKIGGAEIQTMLFPVRYTDFDGNQDRAGDRAGVGVVEKYIENHIPDADIIITISQYNERGTFIDKFASSSRGGGSDDLYFTRKQNSDALPNVQPDDRWIKTTLPSVMCINLPSNGLIKDHVLYNWKYKVDDTNKNEWETKVSVPPNDATTGQKNKLIAGSGGSYLSNEIFYRVAKMRKEKRPSMPTGHMHVQMIQTRGTDLEKSKMDALILLVKESISKGAESIQYTTYEIEFPIRIDRPKI